MESSSIKFHDTRPDPVPPPPGVEANFDGPNTNGHIFIAVAIIGILLATISSFMRAYTKAVLTRSFGIDDGESFFFSFVPLPSFENSIFPPTPPYVDLC